MESEREGAKASISSQTDADLSGPVDAGTRLRILVEQNFHARKTAAGERGWFGALFGNKDNSPVAIASLITAAAMLLGFWCLARAANNNGATADFWAKQFERCFALTGTALGFIFGRGSK